MTDALLQRSRSALPEPAVGKDTGTNLCPLPARPMQCALAAPGAACRAQRQVMAQQYPHRVGDHAQMQLTVVPIWMAFV